MSPIFLEIFGDIIFDITDAKKKDFISPKVSVKAFTGVGWLWTFGFSIQISLSYTYSYTMVLSPAIFT